MRKTHDDIRWGYRVCILQKRGLDELCFNGYKKSRIMAIRELAKYMGFPKRTFKTTRLELWMEKYDPILSSWHLSHTPPEFDAC